ncbi:class I SAM-dependent methyltransferase [filamentous cyanobacterium LEGE 11480]|uniref:Class I SAM-dependent methyltransferase n=2 Tax=Romeriopsis TaxID=2992131 RepID=A0A928VWL0_9CYAN|nr:class I SAM-dependent methyltransferase [Romeriopsis navalis LEGE 11480]
MPKQGEIDYLKNIGEDAIQHAVYKPFSDAFCGSYLMEIGAMMTLLPQPPGRLLDLGCGTGWTSCFWAKRGYHVVGQDIAADMIHHAEQNRDRQNLQNLDFVISDYESMDFHDEFDCAVFFDCLHHAVDEVSALRAVYQALRPGGVCITSEPGEGHSKSPDSIKAMQEFGVTERDMPPWLIKRAAQQVGFRRAYTYPHTHGFISWSYRQTPRKGWKRIFNYPVLSSLGLAYTDLVSKHKNGIVLLVK